MATVLYITAHPHDDQVSYSMAVGKAFIEAYREAHPQDEVITLDLYKMDVPHIDVDVFSGWGKPRRLLIRSAVRRRALKGFPFKRAGRAICRDRQIRICVADVELLVPSSDEGLH